MSRGADGPARLARRVVRRRCGRILTVASDIDGVVAGLAEKAEANAAAILSDRSHDRGGSDQEDRASRASESRMTRFVAAAYAVIAAEAIITILTAAHIL